MSELARDPAPIAGCSGLQRRLGSVDAAAIVISNVIGVGIFATPGIVAAMAPAPWALLAAWSAGGLLAFAGATAYAELASRLPRAGGEYVYLRESYGSLVAFLSGWTSFVAGFSGAIAAGAIVLTEYLGRFAPLARDRSPFAVFPLGVATLTVSPQALIATAVIVTLAAIHVRGLTPGRRLQNSLTGLKIAALLALIVFGLIAGRGSVHHFTQAAGPVTVRMWMLALIPVMFSYSGWNAAAYVAEEVRDPRRNVPRALALGTAVVILIYLGVNVLYLQTLPISSFDGVRVGELATRQTLGPAAASAMSALIIVIILGSLSAMTLVGPRVYYAMARDGQFFAAASRVHARFRTPASAIVAQACWSTVLVLTGTFEQLLAYTGFAVVLFSGIAVTSLFVLRRQQPDHGAFRAWGYPIAPAIFAGASLLIVSNAVIETPRVSAAGLLVIGAGVPLFFLFRQRSLRVEPIAPIAPAADLADIPPSTA